jgi:hypothetical protein
MQLERERLQSFLVGGDAPPKPETLRCQGLASWAFASIGPDHPYRAALRSDFVQSVARHQQTKNELLPLLDAWRRSAVDFLLFKGFWLSETVYPERGLRFYGDVDVLLRPSEIGVAKATALQLGWTESLGALRTPSYAHGAFNLDGPDSHVRLDAHRFLLHSSHPWHAPQTRITNAMWARSRTRRWEGLDVRELDPVDAMLLLILQRSWGEGWQQKPADILDLRCLVHSGSVRREQVYSRAFELNCYRSVLIFMQRCDPWQGRVELAPPTARHLRSYRAAVFHEHPLLRFDTALKRLVAITRRGPSLCLDIWRALPSVMRAQRALRASRPIGEILRDLTPSPLPAPPCTAQQRIRTIAGVRWALRLLTRGNSRCLLRSLALYHALRAQGSPVTFVSGVCRRNGTINSHAWVELNGQIPPELRESISPDFTESFRHPAPD